MWPLAPKPVTWSAPRWLAWDLQLLLPLSCWLCDLLWVSVTLEQELKVWCSAVLTIAICLLPWEYRVPGRDASTWFQMRSLGQSASPGQEYRTTGDPSELCKPCVAGLWDLGAVWDLGRFDYSCPDVCRDPAPPLLGTAGNSRLGSLATQHWILQLTMTFHFESFPWSKLSLDLVF